MTEAIDTLEDGLQFYYDQNLHNRYALNALRVQLGQAYLYAMECFLEQDDVYKTYSAQCPKLVERILHLDANSREGVVLMQNLHQHFGANVGVPRER